MNMFKWLESTPEAKKSMPVLSFPGMQFINTSVDKLVQSSELQAQCMKAIADRYDTLAAVSLMDLSVEAEAFGSPIRFSDDEVPTVTAPVVTDEDSANALTVPKVGDARTGLYVETLKLASERITDRPVLGGCIGPFSLAGRLMDMTEIMVMCYDEPEMVHAVLDKVTTFLIEYNKAFKATGANGVVMAEPAAGLLSPDLIDEFSSPYVKRIIEAVEDESFLFVYHNCGNTTRLVDSIVSTGARVVHLGNAIDLAEMIPQYPSNIIVMGNVDPSSEFRNGTPESVKTATLAVLNACSKFPNFVLSSGCDIPPVSPIENIDAFFNTAKEFYK